MPEFLPPLKEEPPVGGVIRWQKTMGGRTYSYAAIHAIEGKWFVTGTRSRASRSWSELLVWINTGGTPFNFQRLSDEFPQAPDQKAELPIRQATAPEVFLGPADDNNEREIEIRFVPPDVQPFSVRKPFEGTALEDVPVRPNEPLGGPDPHVGGVPDA
jgi:hypothetical protein